MAEIRSAVVNEVNELGDTALSTAAERGHLEVVKELLKYTTKDAISHKNRSGLDPLHLAASNGHQGSIIIHFFCPEFYISLQLVYTQFLAFKIKCF